MREERVGTDRQDEIDRVERAISDALAEIRTISRGLSLPDVAEKAPAEIVRMAIEEHRSRTGNHVDVELACDTPVALPLAVRLCLYRFVQEGLNNASRHAKAVGMGVYLSCDAETLSLAVRDAGPGISHESGTFGLGLSGLRDRVESLGGEFRAGSGQEKGGELQLNFALGEWK